MSGQGPAAAPEVRPVAGGAFEDILDGYFPLQETIRQMMRRNGFQTAWLTLLHAPVMEVQGLSPSEPVPLHLRGNLAGMIDRLVVEASVQAGNVRLRAIGDWWWVDPDRRADGLTQTIRLGEPAFVRGVGVSDASTSGSGPSAVAFVSLDGDDPKTALSAAAAALSWTSLRAWCFDEAVQGIERRAGPDGTFPLPGRTLLGQAVEAGRDDTEWAWKNDAVGRHGTVLVLNTSEGQDGGGELARLV